MFVTRGRDVTRGCAAAFVLSLVLSSAAPAADDKPYVMKITLATVNDALHEFAQSYAAAVEKDSAGRIKTEIYPASQLGSSPRQAEAVQFGEIQCLVAPPDFLIGIDQRFEVLGAPGLVKSMAEGQRLAADPAVQTLMLGLGAGKGLRGVALFMAAQSGVVARTPIRHLADFRGKKIRIFASQFQSVAIQRLGAIPKPMSLGDVLPALQDNAVDGALGAVAVFGPMHYIDVAKYITEIGQPAIFAIVELSRKWYESLPADLQAIVDRDAAAQSHAINPWIVDFNAKARQAWTAAGGELISLPPDEQSSMLKIVGSAGDEVSSAKPELNAAYQIVSEAAERSR